MGDEGDWTRDRAIELLNEAKLAPEAPKKTNLLQQVLELVLRKAPRLLDEFVPNLLELQVEPAPGVRKWLAGFCEQLAVPHVRFLPQALACVQALARDSQHVVAKRAVQAASALYRKALLYTVREGPHRAGEVGPIWAAANALKSDVVGILKAHGNDGVRLHAAKFVEGLVMMLSADGSDSASSEFSASSLPPHHPFLSVQQVEAEAGSLLGELLAPLGAPARDELAGPFLIVLLTAASNLARARDALAAATLKPVLEVAVKAADADQETAQAASIAHAVKQALTQTLKMGGEGVVPFREQISEVLGLLGANDAAEAAIKYADRAAQKRKHAAKEEERRRASAEERAAKRIKVEDESAGPANGSVSEPPGPTSLPFPQLLVVLSTLAAQGGDRAELWKYVEKIPNELMTDVVIANMQHLPPFPPPELPQPRVSPTKPEVPAGAVGMKLEVPMDAEPAPVHTPQPMVMAPVQPLSHDQRRDAWHMTFSRMLAYDDEASTELRTAVISRVATQRRDVYGTYADEKVAARAISDYATCEGQELAAQWLYAICAKNDASSDARYEAAFMKLAQGLLARKAESRLLVRLLLDAPLLPPPAFELLQQLVGLDDGSAESHASNPEHFGQQVVLGLSCLCDLILERPPVVDECLAMVLRCAVHKLDAVRMKAIRLIASRLFTQDSLVEDIEREAVASVCSLADGDTGVDHEAAASGDADAKATALECGLQHASLLFALCSRKHTLLRTLFEHYATTPAAFRPAFHRNLPGLAKNIGASSPVLLELVSAPPEGSEPLVMQVLHTLTDSGTVAPDLLAAGRKLYATHDEDVRFMLPLIPGLSRDELRPLLPKLVNLTAAQFKAALQRAVGGKEPPMSPTEMLVALHTLETSSKEDGLPLKKVMEACNTCFQARTLFTPEVLASALQQIVELTPLPLIFMRTVIQTGTAAPNLKGFVIEILSRLVTRQVWRMDPKLWDGWLRCVTQNLPASGAVMLQLPAGQLEDALAKYPDLREKLVSYTESEAAAREAAPRATLAVLGL